MWVCTFNGDAMALGIRCARDCIPPIRLAVIEDLNQNGKSNIADVAKRLSKPRKTVKRGLESLSALGICVETAELRSSCSYSIADGGASLRNQVGSLHKSVIVGI